MCGGAILRDIIPRHVSQRTSADIWPSPSFSTKKLNCFDNDFNDFCQEESYNALKRSHHTVTGNYPPNLDMKLVINLFVYISWVAE